jgi:hypothetical protein
MNTNIGETEKSALLLRVHQLMQEAVALSDYKEV